MTDTPNGDGQDPSTEPGQDPNGDGTPQEDKKEEKESKLSAEAALAELSRARKDAAAYRKKLADSERKAKEIEDSKLSADEKTQKKLAEMEERVAKAESRATNNALKAAAASNGAHNPDEIAVLIPAASLEFDDVGNATNVDALVEGLKKSSPHLFGTVRPSFDGGARGGPPAKQDMEHLLREAAGH